ncbi:ABC transporter permease [Planococcus sp. SSTMD024]|uniref:ABC transporter permease n=1 Tax=Planococcus sp. SSTMD024 TaxID=3242163 RepID=UPI00351F4E24
MNVSLKRIQAIFIKDYKEFSRNYAVSIMIVFPIVFALLYRTEAGDQAAIYAFIMNFSLAMLTSFVQACLIAEEKERNTLRSLMMTPASMLDVLIGKSALVFLISAAVLAFSTYLFGYETSNVMLLTAALGISILLYTAIGTICGLYSKTLLEASLSVFPVLIIFTAGPFALAFEEQYPFLEVLRYLPSSQLSELLVAMEVGAAAGEVARPLVIISVWTVVLTIVSFILYKKRLMDQ